MMHGLAWCIEWPGRPHMLYSMAWRASHGIMEWSGGPCMGYGMALRASHDIVWPGGHHMVYGRA